MERSDERQATSKHFLNLALIVAACRLARYVRPSRRPQGMSTSPDDGPGPAVTPTTVRDNCTEYCFCTCVSDCVPGTFCEKRDAIVLSNIQNSTQGRKKKEKGEEK